MKKLLLTLRQKWSEYLLEICVIVIGILVAFSLNSWKESRISDKSVRKHLASLAQAIEHDIREQSISMEFNELRFHSWQYLLKLSGIPIDSLPEIPRPDDFIVHVWDKPYPDDSNKNFVDVSMRQVNEAFLNMVFNYSAINEINNLGLMSDINDDSLKFKINQYYYHLDWRFGEQSVSSRNKLAEDLKNYLRDKHAISCTYPPDPQRIFEVIREDARVVIMMKDLIQTANRHYWVTRELRTYGIELVELINKELK